MLWVALAFLEWRKAREFPRKSLADIIRIPRGAHARRLLGEVCQMKVHLCIDLYSFRCGSV